RDVHPRDRDGLAVVHLLRKLACELDGLDVRAERASEDALEKGLDFVLDLAQHWARGVFPAPTSLSPGCEHADCQPAAEHDRNCGHGRGDEEGGGEEQCAERGKSPEAVTLGAWQHRRSCT